MFKQLCSKINNFLTRIKNGFTLVELMIVVAIIALLILVLVPRIGIVKNKSREAGIRVNMTMLEGEIHSVIDDYPLTGAGIAALETRIAADINAADATTNQMMRNPVTGATGCEEKATLIAAAGAAAVTYIATTDDGNDAAGDIVANWPTTAALTNGQGVVGYMAYVNDVTNKINVELIPYGVDGKRITTLVKTISQ